MHKRHASLTPIEKTFLSALLIDSPSGSASKDDEEEEHHKRKIENAIAILDDDILFSLPFRSKSSKSISNRSMGGDGGITDEENNAIDEATEEEETEEYDHPPLPPKPQRSNVAQLDLWKAYNDGVRPTLLKAISERGISKGCIIQADSDDPDIDGEVYKKHSPRRRCSSRKVNSLQRTSTKNCSVTSDLAKS